MERRPIKTIRNQVYQILKDDICEGRFAPGQWLQENELAERLCVSRSPIREALRQLASDGLVVEIPNKGVFVKEFTARDIEEIFDLRVLLEDYAISKLQHHLTTADMQQLIDCLNEMERLHAQKNLRAYTDMDSKLHGLLIELCGNNFSAGQRQLLSFARTIIHKPSVMILDEATANIDTETELLIQDSLEKMRTVGTMLIVAHRLSTIQHADNIIVLSHGKILEQGSHQELLARHGRYYQLYTLQYHKEQLSS